MVTYETALRLHSPELPVFTAVWPNSPLEKKLVAQGLPTIAFAPDHKYLSFSTMGGLRAFIRREKITTVIVQQLRDLWYLVPALIGRRAVRVLGIAHMWIDVRKKDVVHRWLYRRLFQLVALTESHKQNLLSHLPLRSEQMRILPNTVDSQRFHPQRRSQAVRLQLAPAGEPFLIGVVSRLDPKKGLCEVVAAASRLRAWNIPFRIVIVGNETIGEESFKGQLQKEIDQQHLQKQVELIGHRPDIEAVMASFDVLLMPSPTETFGRVLIEAMASEVAVVACAGGGVKDVVENRATGLLTPPGDAQAMAEALRLYAEDPALRCQLAASGRRKAEDVYNPEKIDREFRALLL